MRISSCWIATVLIILALFRSFGQPSCSFEHFSVRDGLPQFTINDILQDNKGFIWLATYDGLSKFDGYEFHNYKVKPGDSVQIKSNRVDKIHVDKFNRIWMESNGDEAHCFDQRTEKFWGLPFNETTGNPFFPLSKIEVKPSGRVWLISDQNGCICVLDSLFNTNYFSLANRNISSGTVRSVHEDNDGFIWILTGDGLTRLQADMSGSPDYFFSSKNTGSEALDFTSAIEFDDEIWFGTIKGKIIRYIKRDKSFLSILIQESAAINHLSLLNQETVLVATRNDGIYTFNFKTRQTQHFNKQTIPGFDTRNLEVVHVALPDRVWFSNDKLGISQLHLTTKKLDYYFIQTDDVSIVSFPPAPFVLVDSRNQLWVHPKGGGFSYYDEGTNQLKPFFNTPFSEQAKFSNMLHSGFFDRQGNLWLGARSHGLDKVVFNKSYFKNQKVEPGSRTLFGNNIRAVYADKSDNIWVSSKENRLYLYNPTFTRRVQLAPNGKTTNNTLWPNAVYSVLEDSQNNIWLGTRGSGVYKFSPLRNGIEYSVEHFEHDRNDEYSLSNNNVYTVFEDKFRRIWIGTWGGGLNRVVSENGKTRFVHAGNRLKNYPKNYCSRVRFITDGRSGHVYLGTTDGLLLIENNPESMDSIGFKLYRRQPGNAQSISNNDIIDVAITQSGDVFMATSGGGINKVVSYTPEGYPQTFKAYTRDEGMPSDLVVSLTEDFSGKLWIGTESGMCRFDPASEHFEVFPEVEWIMNDHSFSEATRCRLKTGEILLGYSGGILSFFPEDIKSNQFTPYLALFNLQLFNKKVPIHGKSPIRVGIDDSKELVLSKKQNFFSIEFAALDLINPKNIKYAYMLEGLDKDWNYTQTKRIANYTNIPKGAYTFRVKSTNSDGVWVSNERVLPITIKPAFWETPLAYTLYFLLFALIIFLVDYNLLTIYRLKSSVAVEKKMSEMKQKFFVDISHEIRTPLTMITAPVEYLLNDGHTPDPVKKQLTFISHSTNRLLRLVNQILDLKKLQDSKLKIQEIELVPLVYEVFNSFVEIAKENSIDLRFKNQLYDEKIWADKDSIEKIVMNLLSNAFKHTGKGKAIEVRLSSDSKYITISVMDEGSGISKERQKNLFVRFMSFNDDPSKPSTGIGLALIKELADKHKAKVTLESETDKGSTFSISFLKGKNHFLNHPEVDFFASNEEVGYESEAETNDAGIFHKAESRTRVLVVEDDHDLRTFIANILEEDYEVLTADDGQSGFETAKTHFPDFIISDIMMPRMDGIELLRCIRNDINTSHIPVVLLTAKANIESKLEGLAYGADDYITKPFSVPYLKARMANLLEQRKRLQEMLGKTGSVNIKAYDPKPFLLTKHDENMMEKVMEAIEQNMDNDKFTIEELATKVGINRTTFQNKMKSLTGFTPLEFVREIRLKRAAQLITDSRLLMKEVSYMTGFTDTKYFGKCFKAKYGVTPLEYRNREK